ncbi:hypothetical protein VUR80DRAFT_6127 [Thermomyces stellatus]
MHLVAHPPPFRACPAQPSVSGVSSVCLDRERTGSNSHWIEVILPPESFLDDPQQHVGQDLDSFLQPLKILCFPCLSPFLLTLGRTPLQEWCFHLHLPFPTPCLPEGPACGLKGLRPQGWIASLPAPGSRPCLEHPLDHSEDEPFPSLNPVARSVHSLALTTLRASV